MMIPRIIKTENDYERALARIGELMDAKLGTPEGDELELLATIVELYEEKAFPIGMPDPIDAIQFRMEQAGLKQKDLVPFLGSPSKVSEVLSGKRTLSLSMIRALHEGLGIPAEVLLQEAGTTLPKEIEGIEWNKFPLGEMLKRNWVVFEGTAVEAKDSAEELLRDFFQPVREYLFQPTMLRQHVRSASGMNEYALMAWKARVIGLAKEQQVSEYRKGAINPSFCDRLVGLSCVDEGPRLAQDFLAKHGIHLVIEHHLPKTYLDGAAMMLSSGSPLIALTIRHDRLDNFWFTLFHELGHIALHLENDPMRFFMDDLDAKGEGLEEEADKFAADALIPPERWKNAPVLSNRSGAAVREFAETLMIHPAIVAGRLRRDFNNYRILSQLLGRKQVRRLFHVA